MSESYLGIGHSILARVEFKVNDITVYEYDREWKEILERFRTPIGKGYANMIGYVHPDEVNLDKGFSS